MIKLNFHLFVITGQARNDSFGSPDDCIVTRALFYCTFVAIMATIKTWLTGIIKKPPFIFPFIALAHIIWLCYTLSGLHKAPFLGVEWIGALWMIGYTVCWIAVCDLRKWGAVAYLMLTMLNQGLYIYFATDYQRTMYTSSIWMIDLMFSFFILLYFKRFK